MAKGKGKTVNGDKKPKAEKAKKPKEPTSVGEVDALESQTDAELISYVQAASAYINASGRLTDGQKKSAQIRLSQGLARIIVRKLGESIPRLRRAKAAETRVAGGLRTVNADVSESDELDGLRLAIEVKPVNLAVGRAIWNRFGDIRAFAVNIHLKFPFCVVGGVLTIPTEELVGTSAEQEAEVLEAGIANGRIPGLEPLNDEVDDDASEGGRSAERPTTAEPRFKSTRHLIQKAVERLKRSGGRETDAGAAHHLEAICVIAYDPKTATIDESLVPPGSGLSWEEFLATVVKVYGLRFESE